MNKEITENSQTTNPSDYIESEISVRDDISNLEKHYGDTSTEVATKLNKLALLLMQQGKRVEASKIHARLLKIIDKSYKK